MSYLLQHVVEYHFRQNWRFDPTKQNKAETLDHMAEVLETCALLKKSGKIRAFGLSNESAWGTANWLRVSEDLSLPRMDSIQNEYSLMFYLYHYQYLSYQYEGLKRILAMH